MEDKLNHLPEKTRGLVAKFGQYLIEAFGSNLYSLIVFGSAARSSRRNGDTFKEGASDINIAIILENVTTKELNVILEIGRKFKSSGLAIPLVFKRGHIVSSLDTFPLEFSDMKQHHILLFGADPLEDAQIETKNLRHQCEVEFKGQLVQLRRGYLASGEDQEALTALISASVTSVIAACRGMVLIAGKNPPNNKTDLLEMVQDSYDVDIAPIEDSLKIKHGEHGGATAALEALFDSYMATVEKLANVVDKL
jgi:hypothetical protein